MFRVHEPRNPTASLPFAVLARLPRILGPAQQLLRDDELYVYHSKCNLKAAIKGEIWQWHQDYGAWANDGVPEPDMTTALLMLDEATEISGCLYFIPGSHQLGRCDPDVDGETTSDGLWTVRKLDVVAAMEQFGDPVAITGRPGTVVLFHPNPVHGSGQTCHVIRVGTFTPSTTVLRTAHRSVKPPDPNGWWRGTRRPRGCAVMTETWG